jgi:O-antigen ligase
LAVLILLAFPIAILATRTRAVWLSSAVSLGILLLFCRQPRVRRACKWMVLAIAVFVVIAVSLGSVDSTLGARLEDRSPLDYRAAVYEAGWQMFTDKPLLGWSSAQIQSELSSRIRDFRVESFTLHNTYLEIAVEHGLLGLALYFWLVVDLFRVGRKHLLPVLWPHSGFLDRDFRTLWPAIVLVYLINASFVVMNYQFVNALLFTLAGLLAAQNRRPQTFEFSL